MSSHLSRTARRFLVGTAFLAICALVGLIAPSGSQPRAEESEGWTLVELSGEVAMQALGGGAWTPPTAGSLLAAGTSLRTAETGAAVLTSGGDRIEVTASSELTLAEPKPAEGILTLILQRAGTILFKVASRPSGTFHVDTPYLAVVVKGTAFGVSVSGEGTSVSVSEGVVSVSRAEGGEASSVSAGQKATTSAEQGAPVSVSSESGSAPAPAVDTVTAAAVDVDAGVDASGGAATGGAATGGAATGGSAASGSSSGSSSSGGLGGAVGGAVGGLGDAVGGIGDGLGGTVGGALGGLGKGIGGLGGALGGGLGGNRR